MKSQGPRPARTQRLALLVVVGFALVVLTLTLPALALPTLTLFGGQLYYAGGDVTIDVVHSGTVYGEVLQLWVGPTALDIADGKQVGSQITLTQQQLAELGIESGDELKFGIHVVSTNKDFVLGPGTRNVDGVDHAYVRTNRDHVYVGFEDLFGGGDRDYNDTIFRFSGVTTSPNSERAPSIPEPGSLFLMISGIGLFGLAYRRR